MPTITGINFVYYGTQADLDNILSDLIPVLQKTVSAFSVLRLGMLIKTEVNNIEVYVRINGMEQNGTPIFAGKIPPGLTEIPFEITPDL